MRKGVAYAGAGLLSLAIVLFAVSAVEVGQATTAFANCLGGTPMFGYPATCTDAMGAMVLWQTMSGLGGLLGIVGLIVLILGVVLQPEGARPGPPYAPQYPPPVYAPSYPPPAYAPPPQGPRTPPPGSP